MNRGQRKRAARLRRKASRPRTQRARAAGIGYPPALMSDEERRTVLRLARGMLLREALRLKLALEDN